MPVCSGKEKKMKSIEFQIRKLEESDLTSLLRVKNEVSVHMDRFKQQAAGSAVYIGAFIKDSAIGYVLLSMTNKEDVMPYTYGSKCADMIDLLIMEPLRDCGIGSELILACEEVCRQKEIFYLGLDVNPADNPRAKLLYERLGYRAVGELHLDGVYEYTDEFGALQRYEDWCVDMIKAV